VSGLKATTAFIPSRLSVEDLVSASVRTATDMLSKSIVELHHQDFPCFVVHNARS